MHTVSPYLAIERSNMPRNCRREVWYMTFTMLISTIKKYRIDPRVATGRNSSRARLILTSVSAATVSFSLTSSAVSFVVFNTATSDSSSTSEPCRNSRWVLIYVLNDWLSAMPSVQYHGPIVIQRGSQHSENRLLRSLAVQSWPIVL